MTRHKIKPAPAKAPAPLFPFAVTLRAVALLMEGDGSPALYLTAEDRAGWLRLYRLPDACQVEVSPPHEPPDVAGRPRVFLPVGSAARFDLPRGRASLLAVHTVRLRRELLEAVQALEDATQAEEKARRTFDEGQAGV